MKLIFACIYFCHLLLLSYSVNSLAADNTVESVPTASPLTLIPSVYVSYRDFDYSAGNGGVTGNAHSIGFGLTGIYKQFYLNLSGETNPAASEETTENLFAEKVDFNRTDWAVSLGYAVTPQISTFIGYKYGKTSMVELADESQLAVDPSSELNTVIPGQISLEGRGVFIGAGGGWAVRDWGYMSFSAAYANMTAVFKDNFVQHSKGSAAGTSLSLKWQAPIHNNLFYNINLIRHDYYYDDFDKFETDISEEILSLRVGITYRFK